MAVMKKKLPIGIDDFEKLRFEDFYYVDKTGLIRDLLQSWGEVNLFTRPRRFGKTLNMSMLKYFFEPEGNKHIFDGLEITKEKELCEKYMGRFPVISISLKDVEGRTFEEACNSFRDVIGKEAMRFPFLETSDELTDAQKKMYRALTDVERTGLFTMSEGALKGSLQTLTLLISLHYGCKVILMVDEYDVPLDKAFRMGYYDKMVSLIRNIFSSVLKSNGNLQFAVLTGCMRISKESIFTGLNNLRALTIADVRFDEYFGFTDREVKELLAYYDLSGSFDMVKTWYDGYQFGNMDVYCPWDVLNYCDLLRNDPEAQPENYWSNTSSNDIVKQFIREMDKGKTKREIERLVAGESIKKEIHQELTYQDMYATIDNLWSVLFMTGYLTKRGNPNGNTYDLAIPNMEIRSIFAGQIMEYFKETVRQDEAALENFCRALEEGDAQSVEEQFGRYLKKTISIRDTFSWKGTKENFYHGILLGLLGFKTSWGIYSNRESGDGYSDICVEIDDGEIGIVIEIKYADDGNLEAGCQKALSQIEKKRYEEQLRDDGMEKILKYGIACYKKRCRVMLAEE